MRRGTPKNDMEWYLMRDLEKDRYTEMFIRTFREHLPSWGMASPLEKLYIEHIVDEKCRLGPYPISRGVYATRYSVRVLIEEELQKTYREPVVGASIKNDDYFSITKNRSFNNERFMRYDLRVALQEALKFARKLGGMQAYADIKQVIPDLREHELGICTLDKKSPNSLDFFISPAGFPQELEDCFFNVCGDGYIGALSHLSETNRFRGIAGMGAVVWRAQRISRNHCICIWGKNYFNEYIKDAFDKEKAVGFEDDFT